MEDRKRRAAGLMREVEEARRQLLEKEKQHEKAQKEVYEAEEAAGKLRKDRKVALDEAGSFEQATRQLAEERDGFDVALRKAHREALRRYTEDLQRGLALFTSQQEGRQTKIAQLQKLRDVRHKDQAVGNLCDAREELRRLLKTTRVPAVRGTLDSQLSEIEAELEKLFPGALDAELSEGGNAEEMQELFFAPEKNQLHMQIFLPLDTSTWRSLESGADGLRETTAVHVAWSIAKELKPESEEVCFTHLSSCGLVILRAPLDEKLSEKSVVVKLPKLGLVTFMFSPLPEPVQNAIGNDYENE